MYLIFNNFDLPAAAKIEFSEERMKNTRIKSFFVIFLGARHVEMSRAGTSSQNDANSWEALDPQERAELKEMLKRMSLNPVTKRPITPPFSISELRLANACLGVYIKEDRAIQWLLIKRCLPKKEEKGNGERRMASNRNVNHKLNEIPKYYPATNIKIDPPLTESEIALSEVDLRIQFGPVVFPIALKAQNALLLREEEWEIEEKKHNRKAAGDDVSEDPASSDSRTPLIRPNERRNCLIM